MLSKDMIKWLELDNFINENIDKLTFEEYNELVTILENLTELILEDKYQF